MIKKSNKSDDFLKKFDENKINDLKANFKDIIKILYNLLLLIDNINDYLKIESVHKLIIENLFKLIKENTFMFTDFKFFIYNTVNYLESTQKEIL